ncbi:MAG: TetR/AcrR family transcriptional regulator [Actinobacteria bacterium]|nr:TetR/AcrR family transcriptional regulator [Actinomycetota bacterium]
MATRKYEQRLRAESAEETRRTILDSVAQCLRDTPNEPLSVDRVARLAGVARSTIYLVFGSRAGLLESFAEDLWARTGLSRVSEAVSSADVRAHLRGGIAAASRMFAAERDVYRALFSMAHVDPASVGVTVQRMESDRAGGMAYLAQRLAEAGELRADTSVDDAAHILSVITSFESLDQLMTARGLSLDASIELLALIAERALCRDRPISASRAEGPGAGRATRSRRAT